MIGAGSSQTVWSVLKHWLSNTRVGWVCIWCGLNFFITDLWLECNFLLTQTWRQVKNVITSGHLDFEIDWQKLYRGLVCDCNHFSVYWQHLHHHSPFSDPRTNLANKFSSFLVLASTLSPASDDDTCSVRRVTVEHAPSVTSWWHLSDRRVAPCSTLHLSSLPPWQARCQPQLFLE